MQVKTLRKCIGSADQFRYKVITYQLSTKGEVSEIESFISCGTNTTSIRRLEEDGNYEVFHDKKWIRVGEDTFAKLLHNHKFNSIRRRCNIEVQKKTITYKDILQFDDSQHFVRRLKNRFMDHLEGITHILNYVFKVGKVIPNKLIKDKYWHDINKRTLVYEKDLDMLIICDRLESGVLTPRTTYSPDSDWFRRLLIDIKGEKLSTLEEYAKFSLGENETLKS